MTRAEITVAARQAVDSIIRDLSDRRGLDNEWDMIDDETRAEIRAKWQAAIEDAFSGGAEARDAWIRCDERMPEDGREVLIASATWGVTAARLFDGEYPDLTWCRHEFNGCTYFDKDDVRAWRELPAAPEETK